MCIHYYLKVYGHSLFFTFWNNSKLIETIEQHKCEYKNGAVTQKNKYIKI